MHEVSMCEGIVSIVEAAKAKHRFARATRIRLEIGPFGHVDPRALLFAFPSVAEGSAAAGAEIIIESTPATAFCADCGETVTINKRGENCPHCGSGKLLVRSGDEMRVKDMEVA